MKSPYYNQVLHLYKTLRYMGRDWPQGSEHFNVRLHNAFLRQKEVDDPAQIKKLLERGNYVVKELEALYKLRTYRAMKQRYYDEDPPKSFAAK